MDGEFILSGLLLLAMLVHLVRFGFTSVLLGTGCVVCLLIYEANRQRATKWKGVQALSDAKAGLRDLVDSQVRLRYLFVDERVPVEMMGMRHVRRFAKSEFDRYADRMEKFMKINYNVLAGRFDLSSNMGLMEGLYEEVQEIFEHFLISTPRYSNKIFRYGTRSLHDVMRAHHEELARIMRAKLKRVVNQTKKRG